MIETVFDADAFNAFEHHGWETNSTDAYQEVFGPITSLAVDELLDAASYIRGLDSSTSRPAPDTSQAAPPSEVRRSLESTSPSRCWR